MKTAKKILLATAFALAPAFASAQAIVTSAETQALTRAAPTLTTEGVSLAGVTGFRVSVSAESARTLSGAGTLQCYVYSGALARWVRNPALDLTLTASGVRDWVSPDFRTQVAGGRLLYAATGVTVSGGATVVVTIELQGAP